MHSQLVVLGGGPGGYASAFLAADAGLGVTIVESRGRLGGTCLLHGCIPSKALLHVARVLAEVDELRADWGIEIGRPAVRVESLRGRKEKVIAALSTGLQQLAKRRRVQVVRARGILDGNNALALEGDDPSIPADRRVSFDHLILATGSVPVMPALFRIDSPRVMDSSGALDLQDIPARLLVIGGGYIGLELGTVYARLGSQVSVAELTEGLLPGADRDLVKPLRRRLDVLFDKRIRLNTRVGSLAVDGEEVVATFEGPGHYGAERFDRVLVAVGRAPNSRGIGLETTSIETTDRGFVVCDRSMRTAEPNILAIGDVAGEPMLAHKATHQAKAAVETILGRNAAFEKRAIPAVVFTDPELAWAGLTEDQAKREGVAYETAVYPWGASGRAQAIGRTEGLTKWLVDPATRRLLGCGMVGAGAGELIGESALAIEMGCEVHDLTETVHPHPTLSETVMNAGEVYLGSAIEIHKPRRESAANSNAETGH